MDPASAQGRLRMVGEIRCSHISGLLPFHVGAILGCNAVALQACISKSASSGDLKRLFAIPAPYSGLWIDLGWCSIEAVLIRLDRQRTPYAKIA
jgi:hypothetical protein